MINTMEKDEEMTQEQRLDNARKALRLIRQEDWRISGAARFFGISTPEIHQAAGCARGQKCIGFGCRIREDNVALNRG